MHDTTSVQRGSDVITFASDVVTVTEADEWLRTNPLHHVVETNGMAVGLDSSNCIVIRRVDSSGRLVFHHTITNVAGLGRAMSNLQVHQTIEQLGEAVE